METSRIADQKTMEDLIRSNLKLFPGAVALENLKIFQHNPSFVISHKVILAKYSLFLRMADGSSQELILRGSSDPENKRLKSFHILRALWDSGFNTGPFLVPQPVGYFPGLHLLLYKNFPAPSLMQLFDDPENRFFPHIGGALNWLAAFHEKKPQAIAELRFNWEEEKQEFVKLMAYLLERFPYRKNQLLQLQEHFFNRERQLLNVEEFSLVHGDFQPNNLLVRDSQICVIDFNEAMLYDELYDLAHFTTQVYSMLRHHRDLDTSNLVAGWEEQYLKKRRLILNAKIEKKLALFRCKTLLRIASVTKPGEEGRLFTDLENYAKKTV